MREASGVGFLGLGTFLPPAVRGNDWWAGGFKRRDDEARRDFIAIDRAPSGEEAPLAREIADAMAKLKDDPFRGARLRHVIDDAAEPSDLEARAARAALAAAEVEPGEIDLVMVASVVPDRLLPSNAPAVQAKCELTRAAAWSLDLGCASVQPQLIAATALVKSGTYRRILMVQSCAASRIVDPEAPVSAAMGDGAAAAVIGALPDGYGLVGHYTRTDGSLRDGVVHAPIVDGRPAARWDRAAGPIRLTSLDPAAGKTAGARATEFCREACLAALDDAGVTISDIDLFVCNQSLGWFLDACRSSLGVPAAKTIDTFASVGNLGPASILFNLAEAERQGRLRDGNLVLMYSPGAGLTRTAAVYRWRSRW